MDLFPIKDTILDPKTKDLITKYFLPKWFYGSDSQIIIYIGGLKLETYNLPEVHQFLLELDLKQEELIKDPYPYFLGIRWDWNLWADLLGCEPRREVVMAKLRGKPLKELDNIVCQKRPSTTVEQVGKILERRGEKYLDIDIFTYTTTSKRLTDPEWGITSNSEYRFYTMLSSLELWIVLGKLKTLTENEYYVIETREIITKDKVEKYRHRASWFKICSNDIGRYQNLYTLLTGNFEK